MNRLSPLGRQQILAILERARGDRGALDQDQAILDCEAIMQRLPAMVAFAKAREGRGRKATDIRVLAALAADVYFHHTGKGPGSTENESKKRGGYYPQFVGMLAVAAHIPHEPSAMPRLCNEVRKALSAEAGLGRSRGRDDYAERQEERLKLLAPHVTGYVGSFGEPTAGPEDGVAELGGYEPARPNIKASFLFAAILKTLR